MSIYQRTLAGECEITTGVFTPTTVMPVFTGDNNAAQLAVTFKNGGAAYNIPSGVTVLAHLYYASKPAMTVSVAMTVATNVATCLIPESFTALSGSPQMVIRMTDAVGGDTVACAFTVNVKAAVSENAIYLTPPSPDAIVYVGRAPYIGENDNWYEWDEATQAYVDTGVSATIAYASDIPTDTTDVSVQDALDAHASQLADIANLSAVVFKELQDSLGAKLTNLITNGNGNNGTTGWNGNATTELSADNGITAVSINGGGGFNLDCPQLLTIKTGDVLYFRFYASTNTGKGCNLSPPPGITSIPLTPLPGINSTPKKYEFSLTATGDRTSQPVFRFFISSATEGDTLTIDKLVVINLTECLGDREVVTADTIDDAISGMEGEYFEGSLYIGDSLSLYSNNILKPKVLQSESDITSLESDITSLESDVEALQVGLGAFDIYPTLEQGTITIPTGENLESDRHIRTGYIRRDLLTGYTISGGYRIRIFEYGKDYSYIGWSEKTVNGVIDGDADCTYLRFVVMRYDPDHVEGESEYALITPGENHGFTVLTVRDLIDSVLAATRDFMKLNKHLLPAFTAAMNSSLFATAGLRVVAVSDLHGIFTSLDDACTLKASELTTESAIITPGDILYGRPQNNSVLDPLIATYIAKATEYCIYHCMGQHEVGFSNLDIDSPPEKGRMKVNCFSHAEVFTNFYAPLLSTWGLTGLTTNYYYKDFSSSKIRLISLYQYNIPLTDDPLDSDLYKHMRALVWYGQEQIDWLVATLGSTPADYQVIILQHQADGVVTVDTTKPFSDSNVGTRNQIISGAPVIDIVEAYINKTALSQTYHCADTITYPTEDFEIVVSADFSEANGTFANYIMGDSHVDYVGKYSGTDQRVIGLISSSYPYSTTLVTGDRVESSIVTGIAYLNTTPPKANMARLGQTYAQDTKENKAAQITLSV